MTKTLIFLDIDGTLIKPDQTINDRRLPSSIRRLSKRGFLFGLNSNRSLEDVLPIYRRFHLNGPIVLENGTYFIFRKKKVFLIKNQKHITPRFVEGLLRSFVKQNKLDAVISVNDSVKVLASSTTNTTPLLFLANKYRKFTGSIHILRYGKRDRVLAQKLVSFIKRKFRRDKLDFTVTRTETFGNVIFYPKQSSKGLALQRLKKYYRNYHFYMIGDELSDFKAIHPIGSFFTVGNAAPKVKKVAQYIAKDTYTKGVVETLSYLGKVSL